jgi:hypothetical protein
MYMAEIIILWLARMLARTSTKAEMEWMRRVLKLTYFSPLGASLWPLSIGWKREIHRDRIMGTASMTWEEERQRRIEVKVEGCKPPPYRGSSARSIVEEDRKGRCDRYEWVWG